MRQSRPDCDSVYSKGAYKTLAWDLQTSVKSNPLQQHSNHKQQNYKKMNFSAPLCVSISKLTLKNYYLLGKKESNF